MRYPSLLALPLLLACALIAPAAPAPTTDYALSLSPVQPNIDYTKPSEAEAKQCTVKSENRGDTTGWVVRDANGQVLRRFSDSNHDGRVDTWSFFRDGVEVYRDYDSDADKYPDEFRWYHTGGTKCGLDTDGDSKIDRWRVISAHEVAEEVVRAIRDRDPDAFRSLLMTREELKSLGVGVTLASQFRDRLQAAPSGFKELLRGQRIVTAKSRFVDFGAGRPGTVPDGADGATRDVTLYESASALVETDGKPEQVQLGAIVRVGDAWRLVEAPQVGSDGVELANVFALTRGSATAENLAPSEQMQELMSELEKLDSKLATAEGKDRVKLIKQRGTLLKQLAGVSDSRELREQWYSQLADMLSAAVVEGAYPDGAEELVQLAKQLQGGDASKDLKAHVQFQSLWAEWGLRSQDPKQDYAKVQDAWLKQLKAFAKAYPQSPDTAEAYLQLGMADEFAGDTEEAEEWYKKLATEFASTTRGKKAAGAIRRLNSIGKSIPLEGAALGGGDVSLGDYRGKHVLIQYWATWCEPCKADMAQIKQLYAKYGGRGFAVLGVNLDNNSGEAEAFLNENRLPWKHAYDQGGLEGRLASEMGVMTLPLMVLVDDKGRVVRRNLHVAELDSELKRLIR